MKRKQEIVNEENSFGFTNRTRQEEGKYSTLYPHLINDDVKCYKYKYFRMSHGEYMDILSKS